MLCGEVCGEAIQTRRHGVIVGLGLAARRSFYDGAREKYVCRFAAREDDGEEHATAIAEADCLWECQKESKGNRENGGSGVILAVVRQVWRV